MLTLDIRDVVYPPPRILSATMLVVRNARGEVVKEIHEFRDAPAANLSHHAPIHTVDQVTREAIAFDILRRKA